MGKVTRCRICGHEAEKAFDALVLGRHTVDYFRCPRCGFMQTEEPYWLDEAYKEPINLADTGLLGRNIAFSEMTSLLVYLFFDRRAKFLDFAGGFGVFTRLMRDIGYDFYWHDPMTQNLFSRGFEAGAGGERYELLTTFESFEHFVDPAAELRKMLALSKNIVFSTTLLPRAVPERDWWYYQFEHGQHISFYSKESLAELARQNGLYFYTHGMFHLISEKKLPASVIRWVGRFRKLGLHRFVARRMTSRTQADFTTMLRR